MLEGVRVLDLSRLLPGPFCTGILADLGADVIRIDPPDGQPYSIINMVTQGEPDQERIRAYDGLARNKRSIVLDLKREQGREVLFSLVKTADVVIESFRPGVAARIGVDYETLSAIRRDLIYCSISSFGQHGPYRDVPAHDMNAASTAGILSFPGDADGNPVHPGVQMADLGSGMYAAIGILAALWDRSQTGEGAALDIAMSDAAMGWLAHHATLFLLDGRRMVSRPGERTLDILETADGKRFLLQVGEQPFWDRLCDTLGLPELKELWPLREQEPRARALEAMQEVIGTRPFDEWWALFQKGISFISPLHDLADALADPHALAREMVVPAEHPVFGTVRQLGTPIKSSRSRFKIRRFASAPGADRDEVLRELGWDDGRIGAMKAQGAFGSQPASPGQS